MVAKNSGRLAASGLIIAGAAAAIMSPLAFPQPAYAATETRSFTWGINDDQPDVPATIEVDGETYYLTSQTDPKQSGGSQLITQYFEHAVDSTCNEKQLSSLQQTVPTTYHYVNDGFDGNLQRMRIEYTPIYNNSSEDVSINRTAQMATQDDTRFPHDIQADGINYVLQGVEYEVAQTDSLNNPILYNATATYAGKKTISTIDHYNVTTYYGGELSKVTGGDGGWSMTATYETRGDDLNRDDEDDNRDDEQGNESNNENENVTQSAGVTAAFTDVEGFESANPFENSDNDNESEQERSDAENEARARAEAAARAKAEREKEAENENAAPEEKSDDGLLKYVPIIGGGAVLVIAAGVIIGVIVGKHNAKKDAAGGVAGAAAAGAVAGGGRRKKRKKKRGQDGPVGIVDIKDVTSQLRMFIDDGTDDNQRCVAQWTATLSPRDDIPTLVPIPSKNDGFDPVARDEDGNIIYVSDQYGNPIEMRDDDGKVMTDEQGNTMYVPVVPEYYMCLSDIDGAVSDEMIVYANDQVIYRGPLDSQVLLDTQRLTEVLNFDVPPEEQESIADEIEEYDRRIDEILDENDRLQAEWERQQAEEEAEEQGIAQGNDAGDSDMFDGDFDDSGFSDDFSDAGDFADDGFDDGSFETGLINGGNAGSGGAFAPGAMADGNAGMTSGFSSSDAADGFADDDFDGDFADDGDQQYPSDDQSIDMNDFADGGFDDGFDGQSASDSGFIDIGTTSMPPVPDDDVPADDDGSGVVTTSNGLNIPRRRGSRR